MKVALTVSFLEAVMNESKKTERNIKCMRYIIWYDRLLQIGR